MYFLKNKTTPIIITTFIVISVSFLIVGLAFFTNWAITNKTEPDFKNKQENKVQTEGSKLETYKENSTKNVDDDSWMLILVNDKHPLSQIPDIETVEIDGIPIDTRIAKYVSQIIDDANANGVSLGVCSGFRTIQHQKNLFENEVKKWVDRGYGEDEAKEKAKKNVAMPGRSEHNTGLAVDFYSHSNESANLEQIFATTPEGIYLARESFKFGFIVRYPEGKEDITGVNSEPWHGRFVGIPLAEKITKSGLTFDEYWEKYLK